MDRNKGRRKACDLCYRKKIRCDAQEPRCGHCVVYDAPCTYIADSRKASSRKKAPGQGEAILQARVETLEVELKRLTERIEQLVQVAQLAQPAQPAQPAQSAPSAAVDALAGEVKDVRPRAGRWHHNATNDLPPLHDVLPLVEDYLATMNAILPLFDPAALLAMVQSWYTSPEARNATTWAAIHVVLALASRARTGDTPPLSVWGSTAEHVGKAQSVLTEVITRDTDLLTVQVLLGLVMLFQGTHDLQPASILIATAMRLAQQLGLHKSSSSSSSELRHLDGRAAAVQRSRVFWIAYLLDRDIGLRIGQAPVQHEADIDLDWPADARGEDSAGWVYLGDGLGDDVAAMNFFRARVELARIEGDVYNALLSVAANHATVEARAQKVAGLGQALDAWMASIPRAFHPGRLAETSPLATLRPFCVLYSAHLTCMCLIHQAHPAHPLWEESLQSLGRGAAVGRRPPVLLLPPALLDTSRDFMRLFVSVPRKDVSFIWMTACAYIAGLMCLTVNLICRPHHPATESDGALAEAAWRFVDALAQQSDRAKVIKMRDTCTDLIVHARSITGQPHDPAALISPSNWIDGTSPVLDAWSWGLADGGIALESDISWS